MYYQQSLITDRSLITEPRKLCVLLKMQISLWNKFLLYTAIEKLEVSKICF